MRASSSPRMKAAVWREFPRDLHENLLTFLPVVSLCRFKAVCKDWSRQIQDPGFAARHRAAAEEGHVLISLRSELLYPPRFGWEVLDVANKRSFIISTDFLSDFVTREGIPPCTRFTGLWCIENGNLLAADGGLYCVAYTYLHYDFHDEDEDEDEVDDGPLCELEEHQALFVCNPAMRTVRQLPASATEWSEKSAKVVMTTDPTAMRYEIFFLNFSEWRSPNAVQVYDSRTESWRVSSMVPRRLSGVAGVDEVCPVSTRLKDKFYMLFIPGYDYLAAVLSYNIVTGEVCDCGMDVRCLDQIQSVSLQLVICQGRLFCVTVKFGETWGSIEIGEFNFAMGFYEPVTEFRGEKVDRFLGQWGDDDDDDDDDDDNESV